MYLYLLIHEYIDLHICNTNLCLQIIHVDDILVMCDDFGKFDISSSFSSFKSLESSPNKIYDIKMGSERFECKRSNKDLKRTRYPSALMARIISTMSVLLFLT